ncbi:hypothetical protein V9T40_007257 [Parthenolecanium corni]|uniref:Trafficking protein particle complex subunit 5 n=1 Tax=Parthenolecanium corni TaxID=536013 RepID=A0AAN9U3D1_9HEMI
MNSITISVVRPKTSILDRTLSKGKGESLFGKEADKLEQANDDEYYLKEKDPIVNKFISVPKDKSALNCAVFTAGIIEAVLNSCGFNSKVTAHWYNGTTLYMMKFEDSVIARNKQLDDR